MPGGHRSSLADRFQLNRTLEVVPEAMHDVHVRIFDLRWTIPDVRRQWIGMAFDIEAIARKLRCDPSELRPQWNNAAPIAEEMCIRLPDIGFASAEKRLLAFFVVADFVNRQIEDGVVELEDALMAVVIARAAHKKFDKAFTMFQIRSGQNRIGVGMLNRFSAVVQQQLLV
jgi:hypothetical protein